MTTPDERRPPDIQHFNELDERAPLIPNTSPIEQHDQLHKPSQDLVKDTPLPKSKIFLLSLARFAEPLGFCILFPFVNQMISDLGTPPELVGYRVGWVESTFSLVSAFLMIPWALASNKLGRKPCLIVALYGTAAATVMFGFSQSLYQMLFWRGLGGACSGSTVIVRTLFSEVTDRSNQARAFSFYAFAGNIALLVGPMIGGSLSEPAKRIPLLFDKVELLHKYPFALPGLVVGTLMCAVTTCCWVFLEEPQHREKPEKTKSVFDYLTSDIVIVLSVYSMARILGDTYIALVPLWAYTPVEMSGLGWTPPYIAGIIALAGIFQPFWLLLIMPILDKRMGTQKLTRACFAVWPAFLAAPILANQVARRGWWDAVYAVMAMTQFTGAGISMVFTTVQLLLNTFSSPEALGPLNGFALALNSLFRSASPTFITTTFAFGVEHNILGGYFAWLVLASLACLGLTISTALPKIPTKDKQTDTRELQV